jgi:predicted N-acetyltransferase YhbS
MNLIIRNENANDYRIVEELTREAFWNIHTPGCDEHFILHNLRNSKDFIPELTFIAQNTRKIVGHIAYSRGVVRDEIGAENEIISFGP